MRRASTLTLAGQPQLRQGGNYRSGSTTASTSTSASAGSPASGARKAPSHVSSPRDCLIVQRTAPDARVEMERQRDVHNRIVQDIAQAGTQNRKALPGAPPHTPRAARRSPAP